MGTFFEKVHMSRITKTDCHHGYIFLKSNYIFITWLVKTLKHLRIGLNRLKPKSTGNVHEHGRNHM